MVRTGMSSGCRGTLVSTWSIFLTRARPAACSTFLATHSPSSSSTAATCRLTNNTNWLTGGYGLSNHLSVRLSVHLSVYLSVWLFVRQQVIKSADDTLVIYKTLSLLLFLLSQTTASGTCQVRPRRHSLPPLHL